MGGQDAIELAVGGTRRCTIVARKGHLVALDLDTQQRALGVVAARGLCVVAGGGVEGLSRIEWTPL